MSSLKAHTHSLTHTHSLSLSHTHTKPPPFRSLHRSSIDRLRKLHAAAGRGDVARPTGDVVLGFGTPEGGGGVHVSVCVCVLVLFPRRYADISDISHNIHIVNAPDDEAPYRKSPNFLGQIQAISPYSGQFLHILDCTGTIVQNDVENLLKFDRVN